MGIYNILVSTNASYLYPCDIFFGVLHCSKELFIGLPKLSPASGIWGDVLTCQYLLNDEYPMPVFLDIVYLSILERKFYSIEEELPSEVMEREWVRKDAETGGLLYEHIVVGLAPYGKAALWLCGPKKETLMLWTKAEEAEVNMAEYMPHDPNRELNEVCDSFINADPCVHENLCMNGMPPRDLFDNYMKQFTYRYQVEFMRWNADKKAWTAYEGQEAVPELDYIEEALYDGTHDKLHDGGLMKYHQAGKPKKLAVKWHVGKKVYMAYFWFEDERIRTVFDRFYGAHPDTKTDFTIRIDTDNNKYELSLYRYGLKEPQVISESAYQLIVFKNKLEYYRSENYNQPRGAWIW